MVGRRSFPFEVARFFRGHVSFCGFQCNNSDASSPGRTEDSVDVLLRHFTGVFFRGIVVWLLVDLKDIPVKQRSNGTETIENGDLSVCNRN